LVGLMRGYAHEFAPHMIRVNSIHPSNVATPMIMNPATFAAFRPELENPTEGDMREALKFLNLLPVACIEPSDVSNAVVFLASPESRFITGVALPVDAGAAIK
jgi:(+)-trans-carveol dehydrogenase